MSNRPKLVVANRKMHGNLPDNQQFMQSLLQQTRHHRARYAVCPPHPYLYQAQQLLQNSHIAWGGQNMSQHERGAFTGSVSPLMLKEFGCSYVIIGHSERRQRGFDSDETCGIRFEAALQAGLTPILCIGETLEEYEQGETDLVVVRQLNPVIAHIGTQALSKGVVAYEPVWAIGSGKAATPQHAQAILSFIRGHIELLDAEAAKAITLLYGGSMNPSNASQLLSMPDVDGGLIGGASLIADDFIRICHIANELSSLKTAA
ncbi:triose-phosphate isomerase [Methylophilus medardicus]|uniref:Triosephosphate isomerase n=1 Tax=Methylophilus medardicus TaxID=2588534 RepID=A0A5B8CUI1_9PROT|nr:triose-phosphate isomerase [Methylophilus medardicus]QDC44736.1 triose-phosphate isomerase [Methylophilus medardicus]QDC49743.1 triose-phosphate isomerase [Methylophilus medardicus]QDC53448.1 triose-phosphate isomerase [Methylophilus medardicus]